MQALAPLTLKPLVRSEGLDFEAGFFDSEEISFLFLKFLLIDLPPSITLL